MEGCALLFPNYVSGPNTPNSLHAGEVSGTDFWWLQDVIQGLITRFSKGSRKAIFHFN